MSTLAEITKQALSLPIEERIILAKRMWDSVEHFTSSEVENGWIEEAERRWQEIEEGKVQCLPADEVMKRARQSINH